MIVKAADAKSLPMALRKKWKGSDVYILNTSDTFIAKKIHKSPVDSVLKRMKEAGKNISSKDLAKAIQAARA